MSPLRIAALAALTVVLATAALAFGHPVKGARHCHVFPRDNAWNKSVEGLPAAPDSDRIVRSIGLGAYVHPDFGAGIWEGARIGIPYVTVSRRQHKVPVSFDYADESDRGP